MAQILSFPGKTLPTDIDREEAARTVARRRIDSATADFDRMMAHHADLQRRSEEFNRRCAEAFGALEAAEETAEEMSADVFLHPAFRSPDALDAAVRCA